jgi:hypothetical protein
MMAGTLRVRRSQGALSGVLLVLLGIWGALIPFVGPYFHYAYTPDRTWAATTGRMWLEVLPGAVALVGGIVVLLSRFRPAAVFGAWLAALAGAWFAVGSLVAGHWSGLPTAGTPVGGRTSVMVEQLGFFTGLGVVIVFVAAVVLGRFTVVAARNTKAAAAARSEATSPAAVAPAPAPAPRASISRVLPRRVIARRTAAGPAGIETSAADDSDSLDTADQSATADDKAAVK